MSVKSTPTKDDKTLELRDIELKINEKKIELEKISVLVDGADKSFKDRENKIAVRERVNDILEDKFNSVAGDAELYLKKIKDETEIEEDKLSKIRSDIKSEESRIAEVKSSKFKIINQLDSEINDKKQLSESLSSDIRMQKELLKSAKDEYSIIDNKNKVLIEEHKIKNEDLHKREVEVSKREIQSENLKSELRTWAVRLYTKYEQFMTDAEKKIMEKNKE